jgi:hypothetical protein
LYKRDGGAVSSEYYARGSTQVVTKGTVSLAFAGTGKGVDLGVTFGELAIKQQSAKKTGK